MALSNIIKEYNKKNYHTAIKLCLIALKNNQNYIYYEYISASYYELGKFSKSLDYIEHGLHFNPNSVKLRYLQKKLSSNNSISFNVVGQYYTYPLRSEKRTFEAGYRLNNSYEINTTEPLVSVVTALYNNERTLERCINSVKSQTYTNIEHIVIDGGSDINVLNILKKYNNDLSYVISEKDRGIYNAMNKGIKLAQGKYICLVNSDDFYDKEHIEKLVKEAEKTGNDVTYTNFNIDNKKCKSSEFIDEGIYFGNLNVNHASFLVNKTAYNKVGLYDENLKIISDIKWIRDALIKNITFGYLDEYTFTFSTGGLSSGSSESHKALMHKEIKHLYKDSFPFLSDEECINIYNFRFNPKNSEKIFPIIEKYNSKKDFINATKEYIEDCIKYRDNFNLEHNESDGAFLTLLEMARKLDIDISTIRIRTKFGCFSQYTKKINEIKDRIGKNKRTILHYAYNFSTPSETFIYDLVLRLEKDGNDCIFLCDEVQLENERPLKNTIHIPWAHLRKELRETLYRYLISETTPDLLISHFALNDWKLKQRLSELNISIATISMTHGIDVFMLNENNEYQKFLLNEYSTEKDNRISTVSRFLKDELIKYGIKEEKIDLVHNSISDIFLKNRKQTFNQYDEIKILTIGRCIEWKGHDDSIKAISLIREKYNINVNLTIVYGRSSGCLDELINLTKELNLESHIKFVEFVNFSDNLSYFHDFDIYIQASKYSNDATPRTETFGVAALEAIIIGLPIVVTNAGGLPEVIGRNTKFSRIAKSNNYQNLSEKIIELINNNSINESNISYAKERLDLFSEKEQIKKINILIDKVLNKDIKVSLLSSNTIYGAGYAAYRVLQSLRYYSTTKPVMYTPDNSHIQNNSVHVIEHPLGPKGNWRSYQIPNNSKNGLTIFSNNEPILDNEFLYNLVKDCDVIHLHWIARFLSFENIAFLSNLNKPLIITIRDMNPLTGGCHYFHSCDKWKKDCHQCPQLLDDINDITYQNLLFKKDNYNFDNITITCLSAHTKEIIKDSIYKNCKTVVIPNSIELNVFKPDYKRSKRNELKINNNTKVIGFVPSFNSDVKGFNQAIETLNNLYKNSSYNEDTIVLIIGNGERAVNMIDFNCINVGYIQDNHELAKYYSAMDILILPSLEETFSNTTAEAIACGTPVAGFKTGAIGDLAIDNKTGKSVEVGNIKLLEEAIVEVLNKNYDRFKIRNFASSKLDMRLQARAYEDLYREIILSQSTNQKKSLESVGFYNYDDLNRFIKTKGK
jgi:glycosyltransferase involved in cell wall biosynthesis